jgi:predicted DNA-binding transcriptional regulator YafY
MQDHHTVLTDAIENRSRVQFKYKSTDEDVATVRTVEPWVYGYKLNGKETLLGYQVEPVGMTKRFDLRRVKHIEIVDGECTERPEQIDATKWEFIHARYVPNAEHA